jgi:hypothetical protein
MVEHGRNEKAALSELPRQGGVRKVMPQGTRWLAITANDQLALRFSIDSCMVLTFLSSSFLSSAVRES